MTIEANKTLSILSTALIHVLDIASEGKIHDSKEVGIVHSTISKDTFIVETWLIKFNTETCTFSICQVNDPLYEDGMVLYWDMKDPNKFIKTNLFGDRIIDEDALNEPLSDSKDIF
jgi:hypothetical protein